MQDNQEIIFTRDYMPQFREADTDGLIGLKGYMNYFQDTTTYYMHNLHLGNDTLPEQYGIVWLYTKYKIHIEKKADFSDDGLQFETWANKGRSPIVLYQDLIISRKDEIYAYGRVELCLFNMQSKRICRLGDINYPLGTVSERKVDIGTFERIKKEPIDMQYCYTHKIRYTDLDKSKHMNNLQFISMLLNAFDSRFYEENFITDFEIHYLAQCFEGEEIKIYKVEEGNRIILLGEKAGGKIAVQSILTRNI